MQAHLRRTAGEAELEQLLRRVNAAVHGSAPPSRRRTDAELEHRLARAAERLDEAEAMARPPRGRPRPASGTTVVRLFHYSPTVIRTSIRPGSYWTDFGGRNRQNVARITGRNPVELNYRYELWLTDADRNRLFRNTATVMRPGLPAANEYLNRVAIPISWMQRVTPMP